MVRPWRPVAKTIASPAAWFFVAAWLIALGILAARGYAERALGAPIVLVPLLLLGWVTVLLTDDLPESKSVKSFDARTVVQLFVVVAIVALFALSAMSFYGVGPRALGAIPVWSGLFRWLLGLGQALPVGAPAAISNPVLEFALPLALLTTLGARWRDLGIGRGHRVGRVLALWSVPLLVNLGILLVTGRTQPSHLAGVFIRNAFQNGPVEEFLFRGALLTRLSLLLGGGWGLVVSALVFGVFHVGANAHSETGGDLVAAACAGIADQAPFGIAFGLIFQRTRNLLAGSVVHMLIDLP